MVKLESIINNGEINPNRIIMKNKDLEHRLDINYKNNGADFLDVEIKDTRLQKIIKRYNNYYLKNKNLDYDIVLEISIMNSYSKKGFNIEYISGYLNSIDSILDNISVFKNSIYERIQNNKKIYPYFLSLEKENIILENVFISDNVVDNFNKANDDDKKIFYYMYEVEIDEMYNNLLVKQEDLINFIKKIIIEFENKLSQREKIASEKNKEIIKEKVKSNIIYIMDLYKDDEVRKLNINYLPKTKKTPPLEQKILNNIDKLDNMMKGNIEEKRKLENEISLLKREQENIGLDIKDEKKLEEKIKKSELLDRDKINIERDMDYNKNNLDVVNVYAENVKRAFGRDDMINTTPTERDDNTQKKLDKINNKVEKLVNIQMIDRKRGIVKSEQNYIITKKKTKHYTFIYIVMGIFFVLFLISYFNKK